MPQISNTYFFLFLSFHFVYFDDFIFSFGKDSGQYRMPNKRLGVLTSLYCEDSKTPNLEDDMSCLLQ